MEAILRNVDTENLEQGYKTFIGRVLREASDDVGTQQKEGKVLAEGEKEKSTKDALKEGVVVTGDQKDNIIEEGNAAETKDHLNHLRRLAGIK
jgi:hypothetical protein